MASYQLWSPWTSLDESLQWIRRATPRPCSRHPLPAHTLYVNSYELWMKPGRKGAAADRDRYTGIIAPQPLPLRGLDVVFGRFLTAQPPMRCSSLCISDNSAFLRVISSEQEQLPLGFKETNITRAIHIYKQLLFAILLLYTIHTNCAFKIHHS
ncbi:FANCD2 opposite strand protein [Hyla sarda]|uniref:FANCD2 opposite strand protein n=1 Tax=Hyla sarda TaxID=327740 RepID=UPI0024C29AFD|nr:FANCD2 opposite strand protein [Hyla sarda]XP_056381243.1 FANCD2 opposite strand protein [Hyla sarda]